MSANVSAFDAPPHPRTTWSWDRDALRAWQLDRLNEQFAAILPTNKFYREKFGVDEIRLSSLDDLQHLPMTCKSELVASVDGNGWSGHQTYPPSLYSRLHRTSGTTGTPLMICDTADDWRWWSSAWQHVLEAAEISPQDRVFLAFSFGPFVGFWSAHQGCADRGAMVIPGGGLSSLARLEFMRQSHASVIFSTPSYALHLAEIAQREGLRLCDLNVNRIIVAGEAGGSVPALRSRIECTWNARLVDHCGATEIGPWGLGWPDRPGIQVIESHFIAELLPLNGTAASLPTSAWTKENAIPCELVLTSLGRWGAPVIRYRTGDVVMASLPTTGECPFLWLEGGVVGRADDMVTIRAVNIFPSSIDAILREFPSVREYRVHVAREGELDQLRIEVEAPEEDLVDITKRLDVVLGLRIPLTKVPYDSLPRSEGKARRWIDTRGQAK
jgi:phenylacetate-CoA ligase